MHPKKIIKLDPKQKTLFGLLGQQIRPTWTTKSETTDDGNVDNENPQSQIEPTNWTHEATDKKKVSALYHGLVKTDKLSVLNHVSQVFDYLSLKLKFYENIFISLWEKHFLNTSVLIDSGTIVSYFSGSFLVRIKATQSPLFTFIAHPIKRSRQ